MACRTSPRAVACTYLTAATTPASTATGRGSRPFSRPPASAVVHTMNSTSRGSGSTRAREPASVAALVEVMSAGWGRVDAEVGELGAEPLGDVVLLDHVRGGLAAGSAEGGVHGQRPVDVVG